MSEMEKTHTAEGKTKSRLVLASALRTWLQRSFSMNVFYLIARKGVKMKS